MNVRWVDCNYLSIGKGSDPFVVNENTNRLPESQPIWGREVDMWIGHSDIFERRRGFSYTMAAEQEGRLDIIYKNG